MSYSIVLLLHEALLINDISKRFEVFIRISLRKTQRFANGNFKPFDRNSYGSHFKSINLDIFFYKKFSHIAFLVAFMLDCY